MTQKIVSVSLNDNEYKLFLALKKYYETDVYKIYNAEVFKIAMVELLKQKTEDNLKKYNSKYESK